MTTGCPRGIAAPLLGAAGVGALALGATTWALGASAGSSVQLVPVPGAPPSGAAAIARPALQSHAGPPGHRRVAPAAVVAAAYAIWADGMSRRTGVATRALEAYAVASGRSATADPACHLSWTTLAGVGSVESGNGADGDGLRADGRSQVPIYGPALDGVGKVASVSDSDGGALDGTSALDRAVGPLQFLPSTWRTWASDGDGDGVRDPQDIDDAALTAARYLCASGDLADAAGWTDAVLSYNHSTEYVRAVFSAAEQISTASAG